MYAKNTLIDVTELLLLLLVSKVKELVRLGAVFSRRGRGCGRVVVDLAVLLVALLVLPPRVEGVNRGNDDQQGEAGEGGLERGGVPGRLGLDEQLRGGNLADAEGDEDHGRGGRLLSRAGDVGRHHRILHDADDAVRLDDVVRREPRVLLLGRQQVQQDGADERGDLRHGHHDAPPVFVVLGEDAADDDRKALDDTEGHLEEGRVDGAVTEALDDLCSVACHTSAVIGVSENGLIQNT